MLFKWWEFHHGCHMVKFTGFLVSPMVSIIFCQLFSRVVCLKIFLFETEKMGERMVNLVVWIRKSFFFN